MRGMGGYCGVLEGASALLKFIEPFSVPSSYFAQKCNPPKG